MFYGNSRQKDPSISMHRFPRDPTLRSEWIKALNLDDSTIKDHHRVCSRHFPHGDPKNKPATVLVEKSFQLNMLLLVPRVAFHQSVTMRFVI